MTEKNDENSLEIRLAQPLMWIFKGRAPSDNYNLYKTQGGKYVKYPKETGNFPVIV